MPEFLKQRIAICFLIINVFMMINGDSIGQCGSCQYLAQLITNGDFESGNSGFTTDYTPGTGFFCPLCDEGTYAVGPAAVLFHFDFQGSDHTDPPFGNFMVVNGIGQSGTLAWCQQVTVQPFTDYTFSYWAQDVTNNNDPHPLAQLMVSFDGVLTGDTLIAQNGWQENVITWNSGSLSSVEVCIVNLQDQTGGNDFGIDDISMTACQNYVLGNIVDAGPDQQTCSNQSIQLGESPVGNFSYSWNNSTGLNSVAVANPTLTIPNTGSLPIIEEYVLTIDSAGVGCIQTDTVLITILPVPDLFLGNDTLLCPGETTMLDAGSSWDSILWSGGETTETIVTGEEGITSVVTYYGPCEVYDEIEIDLVDLPVIDLGDDIILCEGETEILNAGVSGLWSTGITSDEITVSNTGEYWILHNIQGCEVSDTIYIEVIPYPDVLPIEDTYFCEGSSTILNAGIPVAWDTGQVSETIEVYNSGNYTYVVNNGPCIITDNAVVTEILLPEANLGSDIFLCEGESVTLSQEFIQNDWYEWSTGDSTSVVSVSEESQLIVIAGNECGEKSDTVDIYMELCGYGLFIPNAFTPNGDLFNEGWSVQGFNIERIEVFVYNRLGNEVFYTQSLDDPWQPDELLVGDDAYNYFIAAYSIFGERIERTGHIYLLK